MIKLYFVLYLLRINNLFIAGAAVLISSYLLNEPMNYLLYECAAVVMLTMGLGNIINNFLDIKTDSINHPDRALLSNRIKKKNIILICFLFLFIIFLCSIDFDKQTNIVLYLIIIPSLLLYNFYFKQKPLIGNILVSALLGSVFLFTELTIQQDITHMHIPFFLALCLSLLREIIKDLQDYQGDKMANMTTLPILIGKKNTNYLLIIFTIIASIIFTIPYLFFNYNIKYIYFLTLFIEIPLIYSLFLLIKIPSKRTYKHIAGVLKLLNIVGLLVIMVSKN